VTTADDAAAADDDGDGCTTCQIDTGAYRGARGTHRLLALSPGRVCVVVGGLDQVLLVL
jgi:hypothetical protein